MFDARYHALTLTAVFVALAIGLLLGVAVGDKGLVSSAERGLREDLQERVGEARAEVRRLEDELKLRDAFEAQTASIVGGDRLRRKRVAVIYVHEPQRSAFELIRSAVQSGGGEISLSTTLREPLQRKGIAAAATGTRYERLAEDDSLLEPFARRMGQQLVGGARFGLLRRVRRELLASSSGELADPVEAVVIVRGEPSGDALSDEFVRALIDGMKDSGVPVVGAETTSSDPSQVSWYRNANLPSVDNVDQPAGRAALVYALAGAADGSYGVKSSADALIPEALIRAR